MENSSLSDYLCTNAHDKPRRSSLESLILFVLICGFSLNSHAGAIKFWPEDYTSTAYAPVTPDPNGTDVLNGSGSGIMILDDFTVPLDITDLSFEPHFYGGWQGGTVGTIDSILLQWYADDNGSPGTLLFSGEYLPDPTATSNNPSLFGVRLEGSGTRGFYDPQTDTLTTNDHNNYFQIAMTAAGPCCIPVTPGATYWIGYMVETTNGVFGTAVNEQPSASPARLQALSATSISGAAKYAIVDTNNPNAPITSFTDILINGNTVDMSIVSVPIPGAVWLFGSGLLGLIGISSRTKAA